MSDRVIATYDSYAEAERAVDRLSDGGFPVDRVSIVGRDLKTVERVTGRMTLARAALNGAVSGALAGLLIGWLFAVFNWFNPVVDRGWLIFDGLWFGAVIGALWGLIVYAVTRGNRDFTSVGAMQADRYEVRVDDEVAERAARLLAGETAATPAEPGSTAAAPAEQGRFARGADEPAAPPAPAAPGSTPRSDRSR